MPKNTFNAKAAAVKQDRPEEAVINMAAERAIRKKSAAAHFGDYVEGELRANEIEEGLSGIYQDDDGQIVDMKNVEIEHGHSWLYRMFIWLFNLALVFIIMGVGYYYFNQYQSAGDTTSIDLVLTGPKEVAVGQEIEYTVSYRNLDKIDLKNVSLKLIYPDNFIPTTNEPPATQGNEFWQIGDLARSRSGEIKVRGRLIGEVGKNSIFLGSLAYTPSNFSSEFRKDASANSVITNLGLDFNVDFPQAVMVGEANDLYLSYRSLDKLYLDKFRLTISKLENLSFGSTSNTLEPGMINIDLLSANKTTSTADKALAVAASTTLPTVVNGELRVPLTFVSRLNNSETIALNFEYSADGQRYVSFLKKDIAVEVLTRSINLGLLINASAEAQGVNFGQTLNYSIDYANKGEQAVKDLVIVATIDGDFVDWKTLADKNKGQVSGNKITWTMDQLPDLASLAPGQEGTIDFSINVITSKDLNPAKNYQIINVARYSLGSASSSLIATTTKTESDRSNEIILKINSDLSLAEQVRYFDDDNIAVGYGPQPPKVGQTTSYKVYWTLTNSLNELVNTKVVSILPLGLNFDSQKVQAEVGALNYDAASRQVTWDIGKLPITTIKAQGSFNINVTPTSTDANKILILLNGTTVTAKDSSTGNLINKVNKPKTTKLIDDQAVVDDGVVVK